MTQRWLFLFYILVVFIEMVLAAVSSYSLWSYSKVNGYSTLVRLVSSVFGAVAFDRLAKLVANVFGYTVRPVYTTGFGWSYWTGELLLCISLIVFARYIFGRRSGSSKE